MDTNKKKIINIVIISVSVAIVAIMVFLLVSAFTLKPSEKSFTYDIDMPRRSVSLGSKAEVKVTLKNKNFLMFAFRDEGCEITIINRKESESQLGGTPKQFGFVFIKGTLEHSRELDTQERGDYLVDIEIKFNIGGKEYHFSEQRAYRVI